MFGRQPRLPVDLAFGLPVSHEPKSHSQYVHDLKGRLEESYRVATENASKTAERNKLRFDKRVVESTLEAGDRVLVRNVRIRGKHKLADKWEPDVHLVVKRAGDLLVYTVKPEGKDGPLRTLHRDLLLLCGFLPVAESKPPPKQTISSPHQGSLYPSGAGPQVSQALTDQTLMDRLETQQFWVQRLRSPQRAERQICPKREECCLGVFRAPFQTFQCMRMAP